MSDMDVTDNQHSSRVQTLINVARMHATSDSAIGVSEFRPNMRMCAWDSRILNKEQVMNQLEKVMYTAKAHTTGGRDGASRTSDGRLDVKLSSPGTAGTGTNPEQLFAAGWSACFLSALKLVAGKKKIALPNDVAIDAEVDLGPTHGVYGLAARLNVSMPGVERQTAQTLLEEAHQVCPYSNATRGNIEVAINLV